MVSRLSYINTDAVLENAGAFAKNILTPQTSSSPVRRHEHYHWGSPGWGFFPQPVYYGDSVSYYGDSVSLSRKKDYTWVAIPAAVIAAVTMYCIGQNHAEWSQAKAGMAKLQQSYRVVQSELSQAHPTLKSTVKSVFEKQIGILDRVRSDAATGLFLKAILVTAVIVAGIGGIVALPPLLVFGSLSAFTIGCAMLYRAGFSSKDQTIRMEAQELLTSVNQASRVMNEITA
jgi:hypothetical protein